MLQVISECISMRRKIDDSGMHPIMVAIAYLAKFDGLDTHCWHVSKQGELPLAR